MEIFPSNLSFLCLEICKIECRIKNSLRGLILGEEFLEF